ncbi:MAG TPA: hypothetical protein VK828_03015 [Terriglobales bacterium]|nr:hypothetical protein [Terriglobales bacterium]
MPFGREDVVHPIEFAPIAESLPRCLEFHYGRHFRRLHLCFACSFPQSFESYRDPRIDRFLSSITCSYREIFSRAASQFFHYVLREHALTAESDSPVYQRKDYVLAFLTDRRNMIHLDDEFATAKVCSCLLTRIPELGCPGRYELSFHNHPALLGVINERDFQHCFSHSR